MSVFKIDAVRNFREIRLLLIAIVLVCGCDAPADVEPTARPEVTEASWSEQIDAVRSRTAKQIVVHDSHVTAAELADLTSGCERLEVLELDRIDASSDALSVIGDLPNLKRVKLSGPIDDDGIAELAGAKTLVVVNLPAAALTDRGLQMLAGLPNLELLRFHSPNVTDAGLAHIAEMPALRFLHLIDVPVTDAGLEHLYGLTRLESFYLDGSHCTQTGLGELLKALPDLHFHWNQMHLPDDPRADDHDVGEPAANAAH